MTQDDARARVAKGAAHLDQVRPGWFTRIDVGTLTLHDPCGCIVGQLCGTGIMNFDLGRESLGMLTYSAGVEHGFDLRTGECAMEPKAFGWLQDAWIAAIADRLLPTSAQGTEKDAGASPVEQGVTESA